MMIKCLVIKKRKKQVLKAEKMLMSDITALSINASSSVISLFSSDISLKPLQLKQIKPI